MFKRLKTTWLAGGGAVLLVLSLSGVVAGAGILVATGPTRETADPVVVVDTTATFEDTNGNGIDDDCEDAVVADPVAEAAAEAAVDTDSNGVISVSEAAHSDRIGGKNCNHGGYVSGVAHGDDTSTDEDADGTAASAAAKAAAKAARAAAKEARKAERDAAKAERKAAHEMAKAERKAAHDARKAERKDARDARKAERDAARAERADKPAKSKTKNH